MSNPFDALAGPVRDLHEQASWPGVVLNFAPAADDTAEWYDDTGGSDAGWNDDGGESVAVRVEFGSQPRTVRGAGGYEITGDAAITVNPTDHSRGRAGFTAGAGDDNRATEILDDPTGYDYNYDGDYDGIPGRVRHYRVLRVANPHHGLLVLDCEALT